jgi:transcriptional regulator with XRE-family HTH domain
MQEFDWQLGERICQFRRTIADMTQEEFGEEIGVSRQTVNAYARDRQRPTMRTIEAMCSKYNVSPSWLLTGTGKMQDKRFLAGEGDEKQSTAEQITLINYIKADTERAARITRMLMEGGIKNL